MNHLNESVTGPSRVSGPNREDSPPAVVPVAAADGGMGRAALQLGSRPDADIPSALDWDLLNDLVQDLLSCLTSHILFQEPEKVVWKAGRTTTRSFPLFTYRVFYHLDGDDYDPVVVGVTFTVRDGGIRVAGDISGDESGFVYYDEDCTLVVPAEPLAVRDAARAVAARLAAQDAIVLDAIRNRHPRAVAR
jgi:hypothetical protein